MSSQNSAAFAGGTGQLVQTTISYTYDSLYRLTDAVYSPSTGSGGFEFHYTYDPVGNRLTQTTCVPNIPCATTTYSYDDANRLIAVNGVAYTWDDAGNLLNDGTSTYTYDSQNRLKTLTQGGHTYTFTYNGQGDRLTQSVDGVMTRYTLDLNAGLTQVLSDGNYAYLYGVDRIAQVSASETDYFLGDALGSVRQLVDASGAVKLAKSYEPYGKVMGATGSGASAYGFTGEIGDASGLTYLRARYYSSQEARLLTKDLWTGDQKQPMSYGGWSYVYDNPANRTDPSGLKSQNCDSSTSTVCYGPDNGLCIPGVGCSGTVESNLNWIIENQKNIWSGDYPGGYNPSGYGLCLPHNGGCSGAGNVPDGYLVGSSRTMIAGVPFLPSPFSLSDLLERKDCTAPFPYNGGIEGQETVYDFAHLQKAKFTYKGVVSIPSGVFGVQWSFYEGFTVGFYRKQDISAYEGYFGSVSPGVGIIPLAEGLAGVSGNVTLAVPVNSDGSFVPDGVDAVTYGISGGFGADVGWKVEPTFALTYYKEAGQPTNYLLKESGNVTAAVGDMVNDIIGPSKGPGLFAGQIVSGILLSMYNTKNPW